MSAGAGPRGGVTVNAGEVEMIARAEKRVRWAALALEAAARELDQAGELGAVVMVLPAALGVEAERCRTIVVEIEQARMLAGSERRTRDRL